MVNFVPTFEPVEPQDVVLSNEAPVSKVELKGSEYVFMFILDRSGSMGGERIRLAKEALKLFIQSLPAGSSFCVISFGSRMEMMS